MSTRVSGTSPQVCGDTVSHVSLTSFLLVLFDVPCSEERIVLMLYVVGEIAARREDGENSQIKSSKNLFLDIFLFALEPVS